MARHDHDYNRRQPCLLADNCIDYIFIDPPFGDNLHYSELNFFWEAWLEGVDQREPEAVMDKRRNRKAFQSTSDLMASLFQELSCSQAGPVDDRGVPQFAKQCLDRHPGGA